MIKWLLIGLSQSQVFQIFSLDAEEHVSFQDSETRDLMTTWKVDRFQISSVLTAVGLLQLPVWFDFGQFQRSL